MMVCGLQEERSELLKLDVRRINSREQMKYIAADTKLKEGIKSFDRTTTSRETILDEKYLLAENCLRNGSIL